MKQNSLVLRCMYFFLGHTFTQRQVILGTKFDPKCNFYFVFVA